MCRGLSNASVYGAVFITLRWGFKVNWVTEGFWAADFAAVLRGILVLKKMRHSQSKLINNNNQTEKIKILGWADKRRIYWKHNIKSFTKEN